MTHEQIEHLAEAIAARRGWTISTVATYAVNDGKLFTRLAAGGSCTVTTANRFVEWCSEHWPDDLPWPADIPRPQLRKAEQVA